MPWADPRRDARRGRARPTPARSRSSARGADLRRLTGSTRVTSTPRDGRAPDHLRPVTLTRGWLDHAEGSCLVEFGAHPRARRRQRPGVGVPRWRKGSGLGWVTAEYAMLPRATHTRSDRESVKGKLGGRTHEISRLIGRSLRAAIDLEALGENTIAIDCDVLQADGGTRTAAITGAYVALADACAPPAAARRRWSAASPRSASASSTASRVLDLDYPEDVAGRHRHERRRDRRRRAHRGAGHRRGRAVQPRRARRAARPRARRHRRPHPAAGATRSPSRCAPSTPATRRRCEPPAVVLATRNAGKVDELRRILGGRTGSSCVGLATCAVRARARRPARPSRRTRWPRRARRCSTPGCRRSPTTAGSRSTR